MSFGTLELVVEINQSRANSSAKTVATSMATIIKDALKDSTKNVFDSFITDSKTASDSVKSNLSSILSIVAAIKKDFASTFTSQNLKVTLEIKDLQDRLKSIQSQKKELESKTHIDIAVDVSRAKSLIESLHKSIDGLQALKTLDINVDISRAKKNLDSLEQSLRALSSRSTIEVKANATKALDSVNLLNKDLDRIAKREETEIRINADRVKNDLNLVNKDLDRIATKENLQLKLDADKALKSIDSVNLELDRSSKRENIKLQIESASVSKELERLDKELDRLNKIEAIQIQADTSKALKELDSVQKELDRLARHEDIQVKIKSEQALKELDIVQKDLDRISTRENIKIKLEGDLALKEIDKLQKELDRTANRENVELKITSEKALKAIDNVQKDLDRVANRENIDLKISSDVALKSIDNVQRELDRIANREANQLNIDANKALKSIDVVQKELDRVSNKESIQLNIEANKALKDIDSVQKELDRVANRDDVKLTLDANKALKAIDVVQKELDRIANKESTQLNIEANKALKNIDGVQKELDRIANKEAIQLNIEANKALKEIDIVQKGLDRVADREAIQLNIEANKALKSIDIVQKELDRIANKDAIQLNIEANKALKAIDVVQKDLDRIANREAVQLGVDANKALKAIDVVQKELDRVSTRDNVELKLSSDKALKVIDNIQRDLDRVASREATQLNIDATKALKAIDVVQKELDRTSRRDDVKLTLDANKALKAIDVVQKDLDRVANREDVKLTIDANKALKEIDRVQKDLDRVANRENIEVKISSDRALKAIDVVQKELDRAANKEAIQLNIEANKALKDLDRVQKELDRVSKTEDLQLSIEANKALKAIDVVQKGLDRIATSTNVQLKIEADRVLKTLDNVQRELDRVAKRDNLQLTIEANSALKEIDNVQRGLDRLADRENIQLKLDAEKLRQEATLLSKEFDRLAAEKTVKLKIEAKQAEDELKRIQKLEDDTARELKIRVSLEAKQAVQDAKDLQSIRDAIVKEDKIRIDLDIKKAEDDLKRLTQQLHDTKVTFDSLTNRKLDAQINLDGLSKIDTTELERTLAITKEIQKYKSELAQFDKLTLDADDLARAKTELETIHKLALEGINLRFDAGIAATELKRVKDIQDSIRKEIDIQINLESSEALEKAKLLDIALKEVDKESQVRIDLQIKDAENKLAEFNNQIRDTKNLLEQLQSSQLNSSINLGKAKGNDVSELERELELFKELSRYKAELAKLDKLTLDSSDLKDAQIILTSLHNQANEAIQIRFDKATLDKEAKEIELTRAKISKEIDIQISLESNEALEKAKLLDLAIKEVDKESQVRIDLQIKDAESKLAEFNNQIRDTKSLLESLQANQLNSSINLGKAKGTDVSELEKELELFKEVQRYKSELAKLDKLTLDSSDLKDAQIILTNLHNQANEAIQIRFDKAQLDKEAKEIELTRAKISKEIDIQINLDSSEALEKAKLLDIAIKEVDKESQVRIDLQVKDAENKLAEFNNQIRDTKNLLEQLQSSQLSSSINLGKAKGNDVSELERELELFKELSRYKAELAKLDKLTLDSSDLKDAQIILTNLHNQANEAIQIRFDKAKLDKEAKEIELTRARISKEIDIQINLDSSEALEKAKLLDLAIKEVDKESQVRIDLQIKDAESKLAEFNNQIRDTQNLLESLQANQLNSSINLGKAKGNDVSELEKELELFKEVQRYKSELDKLSKLTLDSSDLKDAQIILTSLHNQANEAIQIRFDKATLDKEAKEIELTRAKISKEIDIQISLESNEALEKAKLLDLAIKEVDKESQVRIDLQIKDAENKLAEFNNQIRDTKNLLESLQANQLNSSINLGKAKGNDVSELEKELELFKELSRYKAELAKLDKLTLDSEDLKDAQIILTSLHNQANEAIQIRFDKAKLDKEAKEIELTRARISKEIDIQINLESSEALEKAKLLDIALKEVDKESQVRIDLQIKDAENKLAEFNNQIRDTKNLLEQLQSSQLSSSINLGKAKGNDVSELERELELFKEVQRYKAELAKLDKLTLDSSDLKDAQIILTNLHNQANEAIQIRFDKAKLDKEAKEIELTRARISKEIDIQIKLDSNEALEKAKLLDLAIKEVDKESQVRIDLQIKDAENKLTEFNNQIRDTKLTLESLKSSSLETNIKVGKSEGADVTELERELEIFKEIRRYKSELAKLSKLTLDSEDLKDAQIILSDLHEQSKKAINLNIDSRIAESNLKQLEATAKDTKATIESLDISKVSADIKTGKSQGVDTTELEKELALLKEIKRYQAEIENTLKLNIDADDLARLHKDLDSIHKQNMTAIVVDVETKKAQEELKRLNKIEEELQKELKIKVALEAKQAEQDAKDLQGIIDALAKDSKIRMDLDIKQAEDDLRRFTQQIQDTQSIRSGVTVGKLESKIEQGKTRDVDTSGLEKELALVKEINRYKAELSKVEKLTLSTEDLEKAKRELKEIHDISNETIHLKFGEAKGLKAIKSDVQSTIDGIKSSFSGLSQGVMQGIGQQAFQSFTEGVRGAVGVVSGAVGSFSEFSDSLNQFRTFSGGTEADMKAVSETARQLAMDTSTTATGVAKASIEMVKLGFSATETKDQLAGVVALSESTGLTDMGKAAEIAGAAYSVFGISAEKTADLVSATANNSAASAEDMLQVLSKTGGVAKATGQSIETLSTAFGLMRNSGFTAESAATGLKTALLRLAAPSSEGREALKTLGVSAYDSSGKMKPLLDMLPEFKKSMAGFDDQSKADLTRKIFGDRGGPAFLAMMNQSQEKVEELFNKISNSEGSAKSSAAKLLEGLPGAMKLAKGSIENLAIGLGDALSPALEGLLRVGVEVANTLGKGDMFASLKQGSMEFANYLKGNKELVAAIVSGVGQLVTAMGTHLANAAKDFTTYLKSNPDAMKNLVNDAIKLALNIGSLVISVAEFGKGFTEASIGMSSMLEPMVTFIGHLTGSKEGSASLAENLGKAAAFVIPLLAIGSLVGTITTIASGVSAIVGLFGGWAVVGATVTGLVTGIGTFLAATAVTIGGLVAGTLTFAEVWVTVLGAINPIGLAVVAIGATIYTIITYTQEWDNVCLGFQQTVKDVGDWFNEIFTTIKNTIAKSEVLTYAWEVIKSLITKITEPYKLIFDTVVNLVSKSEFLTGVWKGIGDLANSVGNAFKSVVGGVFDQLIQKAGQLANSLKSMIGMGGSNNGGGAQTIGGSASEGDKMVGAVISILEAPSKQGRVDVAQVLANRVGTNYGGNGSTIRDQAFAPGQFQPFFKETYGIGKDDIQNKETAIQALTKAGYSVSQATEAIDTFFASVADSAMVADSAAKVGGRAYFKGVSQYGNMSGDDFLRTKGENFFHHENGDQKNRTQASISNLFGAPGSGGGFTSFAASAQAIVPTGTLAAQEYGAGRSGGREHAGQDLDIGDNDSFQSYIGGRVTQIGDDPGGYFKWIDVFNEKLQKIERIAELDNLNVKVGDQVSPGQVVGSGTQATGVVHYEIRTDANSQGQGGFGKGGTIDPIQYLESLGIVKRQGQQLIPQKGGSNSGTSVKNDGHFDGDGHNHGKSGSAIGEANSEISTLRSTVKEDEAAKAEKEADKLAKKQEAIDRKNQKAIESAAKMQDQGIAQKRKADKEARQVAKDENIARIDRELATTTNGDAKAALEHRKKNLSMGSTESEKIIESEQRIEDLNKAKERKLKDKKSPLADVKEKANQMPDYSQAIKDEQKLLEARRKLRDEITITASLEFDTANKVKNEEQAKVTLIQESIVKYNDEKRVLEERKAILEQTDPSSVKQIEFQIQKLDLQHSTNLALIEEESKLKKATESRDAYNKTLGKAGIESDDTLKRLSTEVDNLEKKVKDINSNNDSKLHIIDLQEIKNAKELAKALEEVALAKESTMSSSKTNLARGKASVLRRGGDEWGANAIERQAAKDDQVIKNRDRLKAVDKDIEEKSKTKLPYSVEEIRALKSEATELNKIEFSQAGSQFKTLGETIGTTFKESVGTALKDVLTGAKSMGEAFQGIVDNMLSKLAELAVNSLLKDMFGGMFGGGGGGGGGIFGNLFGGLFGGGNSEGGLVPNFNYGGMVPNYADGNLSTIGGNRPYLAGEPFRAAKNSPIAKALQREGSGGVVSVLKANELVLNPSQTKTFFAMGMDQQLSGSVSNYAEGNLSSFSGSNSGSTTSGDSTVTIPITINMSGNDDKDKSGINVPKLQDEVRKTVIAEIQNQQRNGGGLAGK